MIVPVIDGFVILFFFFQAEDGIRDVAVTGVQTCALPICHGGSSKRGGVGVVAQLAAGFHADEAVEIGRASCRGRVEISVVAVSLKKKRKEKNGRRRWKQSKRKEKTKKRRSRQQRT